MRLAKVLGEWDELEDAIDHAGLALALFRQWGQKDGILIASISMAQLLYARWDLDGALDRIREAKHIATELTWYQDTVAAFEVWLQLAQEEGSRESLLQACRWVQQSRVGAEAKLDVDDCDKYIRWAQILTALDREGIVRLEGMDPPLEEALRVLARLLEAVEEVGAVRFVVKTLAVQAIALQQTGEQDRAQTALLRALALAEPEGYMTSFVEEGEPLARLLATICKRLIDAQLGLPSVSRHYLDKLLRAFDALLDRQRSAISGAQVPSGRYRRLVSEPRVSEILIDPLSEREVEVLRLLLTDLSSTEIAEHLYISKNTVRSHIRHIYEKLDAHSRAEAVGRAQELGLL
jgi:LuxR family maltose regulon positive regulatory protein